MCCYDNWRHAHEGSIRRCHFPQSDEERTLSSKPSWSAAGSKGASCSEEESGSKGVLVDEASRSEEAWASHGPTVPAAPDHSASSNEVDNVDSTLAPLIDVLEQHVDQPNRWCGEGQYQVYTDAKVIFCNVVVTGTLVVELQVLKGSLLSISNAQDLFSRHLLERITTNVWRYNEEVVRVFYSSYMVTHQSSIDRRSYPAKPTPLSHDRVCSHGVDISLPSICCFLYGAYTDATREPLTPSLSIGGNW